MDTEPANVGDPGPPGWRVRPPARYRSARRVALVVVLVVLVALATRLLAGPAAANAPAAAPAPSPSASATLTVPGIYQHVAPSVVLVRTGHDLGTGLIVSDDGTILTANHVVAGGGDITVTFADGTTSKAAVASASAALDIATLTPQKLPSVVVPATLGGGAEVGAQVVAIGNPLGLTDSVSAGVVSGLDRSADTDTGKRSGLIQFDAAVNPGSSGGPLLDSRGLVIGIVVAIAAPDGQDAFAGIGFAVPIAAALGGPGAAGGRGPQI